MSDLAAVGAWPDAGFAGFPTFHPGIPPVSDVIEPEPAPVDAYRAAGERFRRLYRAVKAEFRS